MDRLNQPADRIGMNRNAAKELFQKYNSGTATPEERALLEHWYSDTLLKKQHDPGNDDLLSLKHEAWSTIYEQTAPAKRVKLWPRIAVAVAVATVIFGVGLFYFSKDTVDKQAYLNDVAPGVSGATLTLANGKKIRLSDAKNGELAQDAGVSVSKSADGKLVYEVMPGASVSDDLEAINTLSTEKGETYQVKLPDGTVVWLNAASSLKYAANLLESGKRKVSLQGEAYFQVAKDKKHPFMVESAGQQVEVLGTEFNVNAYADEPVVSTTLLEGSVKLVSGDIYRVLKPGQLAEKTNAGVKVRVANVEAITDWKNEEFFLDKMDFRMAMRKLARWYNIDVIYSGSVPENLEAGGWIPRNSKLSDVLKAIESSGLAKFKIEGRKVYVSK